jgi:hypothetical protein
MSIVAPSPVIKVIGLAPLSPSCLYAIFITYCNFLRRHIVYDSGLGMKRRVVKEFGILCLTVRRKTSMGRKHHREHQSRQEYLFSNFQYSRTI